MIINNSYSSIVAFEDVPLAEVFYSKKDSDYFMVIQDIETGITRHDVYNAISLTSGYLAYFQDKEKVERIRGEFKIK